MASPRFYIVGVAALWLSNLLVTAALLSTMLDNARAQAPAQLAPIPVTSPTADCYHRAPITLGERLYATREATTTEATYGNDCRP